MPQQRRGSVLMGLPIIGLVFGLSVAIVVEYCGAPDWSHCWGTGIRMK